MGTDGERGGAGERIVLEEIRRDGGNGARDFQMDLAACQPIQLHPRSQSIEIEAIPRLWIDDEGLLHAVGSVGKGKAGSSLGALGEGCVQLVAQTVIEDQPGGELPRVLSIESTCVAVDGRCPDVRAAGEVGGRDSGGVDEGASTQQGAERIGQRIANMDIVAAALRRDINGGERSASAKVVFPIGADPKVSGVAVQADFCACFQRMPGGGERNVLPRLEEIAIDTDHRSGGRIKRLIGTVIELNAWIGEVGGWKRGGRPGYAGRRFQDQPCGSGTRIGEHQVALAVDVANPECRIDHGLIGVGGGPVQVVEVKADEELRFAGEAMIQAQGKLVCVGHHRRRAGVGVDSVRTNGIVRQWVARQHACHARVDRDHQGVPGKSSYVVTGTLLRGRHRKYLGGSQHLAKALVLAEVKRLAGAVVKTGQDDGAAIGKAELVAAEWGQPAWVGNGGVVKVISGIEGRIAQELKERAVETSAAGPGDDVGKAGASIANGRRHKTRLRLDLFDRVDVEVAEGGTAHLGIADVRTVHGKRCLNPALTVDGELLREVGSAIGIGHGAGSEQQQLAEISLIQGKLTDGVAREGYARLRFCLGSPQRKRSLIRERQDDITWPRRCKRRAQSRRGQIDDLIVGGAMATHGDKKRVAEWLQAVEGEAPIGLGKRFMCFVRCGLVYQLDSRAADRDACRATQHSAPTRIPRNGLLARQGEPEADPDKQREKYLISRGQTA